MTIERTRTFSWDDPMATAGAAVGRTGLEALQAMVRGEVPAPPIARALDFALVAAEDGFACFAGVPAEFHYNPMNAVHGGYACTLLDSTMGCAVMTTLDAKSGYTTSQLSIQLVRPISSATGRVVAEGRVVHRGRSVATAEGKLLDASGKLLAHGTTVCLILPR